MRRSETSRLLPADVIGVGSIGLRTRRMRAALSALGVAIGIASMVAVLGISASSQKDLLDRIDRLGTNLLTVQPGQSVFGEESSLPRAAGEKTAALDSVTTASAVYEVPDATVRRNAFVDADNTSGISVKAADTGLPQTLSGAVASGTFLDSGSGRYPTVVLGSVAARRLGISSVAGRPQVYIGGRYYTVIGILESLALADDLDRAALVGLPHARRQFGIDASASTIYLRANEDRLEEVRGVLAGTVNPEAPEEVEVSRPSDALEAKAAAEGAFTSLLLGLGAVALLVGGVGIANVMVISVLERRSEIGLRRALGATRRHISVQFLTESVLLGLLGGIGGVAIGAVGTFAYASVEDQATVVPLVAMAAGMASALVIGAMAGLYPSVRASRLSPTEALRSV